MQRFLTTFFILVAVNLVIYFTLAYAPLRYTYTNGTTNALLPVIPHNTEYKMVMAGTSHGRIFSSGGNHARVEQILGTSFLNLSKGNGEGAIFETSLFLSWFYDRGNTADTLVYFIDPWVFYSRAWNEGNDFLEDEPLSVSFLIRAYSAGAEGQVLANYLKSKVYWSWIFGHPDEGMTETNTVTTINSDDVKKRIDALYLSGESEKTLAQYENEMRTLVASARTHGTKIIFIVPATLLGTLPEQEKILTFLKSLDGVEVRDLSASITNPQYFYNLDHLNVEGIGLFTNRYLKPLLQSALTKAGT